LTITLTRCSYNACLLRPDIKQGYLTPYTFFLALNRVE
jgi:hypothetical protein